MLFNIIIKNILTLIIGYGWATWMGRTKILFFRERDQDSMRDDSWLVSKQ